MAVTLTVVNLATATFECTFGRGCDGLCCREGRPPVYPDELERLERTRDRWLPLLRPAARAVVEKNGHLVPRYRRLGERVLRVVDGWCVFFNRGCVLHDLGVADGDKYLYKPSLCSLFPIQQDNKDRWYVRQHGYLRESWDLFCLDPRNSATPAGESLRDEIALAARFEDEQRRAALGTRKPSGGTVDG